MINLDSEWSLSVCIAADRLLRSCLSNSGSRRRHSWRSGNRAARCARSASGPELRPAVCLPERTRGGSLGPRGKPGPLSGMPAPQARGAAPHAQQSSLSLRGKGHTAAGFRAAVEPVSLTELAALAGVSRFQFLRAFTGEIGTTPHAYLIQRRVCIARQLFAAGEIPAQAAISAGFADQSHMTRAFVHYLGITPARYRAAVA